MSLTPLPSDALLDSPDLRRTTAALLDTAETLLAATRYDDAKDAAQLAVRLHPEEERGWRVLERCLRGLFAWQCNLLYDPHRLQATLRDMTAVRAELAARLQAAPAGPRVPPPLEDTLLQQLANKYKPSKVNHNYIPHYFRHLNHIRHSARKVCEIGLADQPKDKRPDSLMMWEEFFPNAEIYGLDINPECQRFEGGRRHIFIGDQGDPEFLQRFIRETGGGFDVIIDDGAHTTEAILASFTWLFGALHDHGIYIIEDLMHQRRVQSFLLDLADGVNHWPAGFPFPDWPYLTRLEASADWVRANIGGVAFYRFMCVIMRGYTPEDNPYLKPKQR